MFSWSWISVGMEERKVWVEGIACFGGCNAMPGLRVAPHHSASASKSRVSTERAALINLPCENAFSLITLAPGAKTE